MLETMCIFPLRTVFLYRVVVIADMPESQVIYVT